MSVMAPALRKGQKAGLPIRVGLAAWYRYRIGLTNINGACSQWADQSGNMRPLLQATASARPAILSDGSLSFDGVNDAMAATFTLSQPIMIYLAFTQVTWTSGDVLFDGVSGTVKASQATGSPGITCNAGSSLSNSTTIALNARAVMNFQANGTSSATTACGGAAPVAIQGDAGANNAGGFTLGSDRSAANFSNIIVREIIIYNVVHTGAQRHSINRYLGRMTSVGGI